MCIRDRYESKDEKKAVEERLRKFHGRSWNKADRERAAKGRDTDPYFVPLPVSVRNNLVQNAVKGVYDGDGVLGGAQKHKQPLLNEIAKLTLKNGTYLGADGERLLKKVQSLLPSMQATQQRGGAAGQPKQQPKPARK